MGLSNTFQKHLIDQATRRRFPITANLELLPVCNLNCKMCYIRTDMKQVQGLGGLKRKEEWIALARQMQKAGVLFLLLTGGEVFLYPEFKDLYIDFYEMGFIITINTNATLIDEDLVLLLKKYPPKCVSISLYGASDDSYEAITGQKGMFSRVDRAIKLLLVNGIHVELKTLLTPINASDMEKCYEYAKSVGVFYQVDTYAFLPSRKDGQVEVNRFSPEETIKYTFQKNRMMSTDEEYNNDIIEHLQKYENTKLIRPSDIYGFTCAAANSSCWITWQGHMTPCAMLNEPFTRPFECGFMTAWEELKEIYDRILMSPQCSKCDKRDICRACPAGNYTETGKYDCASSYHCKMAECLLDGLNRYVNEHQLEDRIIRREKLV